MLWTMGDLPGYAVRERDGIAGHVRDLYFDDRDWRVRYLVVELGSWLHHRRVLIPPDSVRMSDARERSLLVSMTREEVEACPPARTSPPVSVQMAQRYRNYVVWPALWLSAYAMSPTGGAPLNAPSWATLPDEPPGERHLRNAQAVNGYHVVASDRIVGRVHDFALTDDWRIEDLVVETAGWPHHEHLMLASYWVSRVSWEMSSVVLSISSEAVFRVAGAPATRAAGINPRASSS
jgi:uncharacterized protein YrrD